MRRLGVLVLALLGAAGCHGGSSSGRGTTASSGSAGGNTGAAGSTSGTSGSTTGTPTSTYDNDRTQWPVGLGDFIDGLAAYRDGGTLDVTGTGTLTVAVDSTSGYRIERMKLSNGGFINASFTDSDHLSVVGDLNGDGIEDYRYAQVHNGAGSTNSQDTSEDTTFGGTFDRFTTQVYDPATQSFSFRVEQLVVGADGGSSRVVVENRTFSRKVQAAGPPSPGCDELDGFPSGDTQSQWYPFGTANTRVRILNDGSTNTCDLAQAQRIARVLRKAVDDARNCLAAANPLLAHALVDALASRDLRISCMPSCTKNGGAVLATTDQGGMLSDPYSWFGTTLGNQRTGLNLDAIGGDDGALEDVLIHELLHWAGDPHKGGDDGNGGRDDVYGCGRYCSRCPSAFVTTAPASHTAAADCAQCSANDRKSSCGLQTWNVDADCTQGALCHGAPGANTFCTSCQGTINKYCDGTAVPGTPVPANELCCPANACPSGFRGPDIICHAANGMTADCPAVPPFCQ